jgi:GTP-binding protein
MATVVETGRVSKVLSFRGIERVPVDEAEAGDIVAIAGLVKATVSDTILRSFRDGAHPRQRPSTRRR